VALFYLAGCSHVETAALLGVPVGAVKTRLHKGRAALRQQLESLWRETTMTAQTAPTDVALRVADVRRHPAEEGKPPRHVVLLEEVGGPRRLPIWVGPFEGTALALLTQGFQPPRPLTFQFAASVLQAAGGRLREVRISRLEGETFYAVAVVEGAAGTVAVDARPSDALSLALTTGARITAAAAVLEAVGAGDPARWAEQERQLYGPGSASAGDILVEVQAQMAAWSSPRREPTPPEGPA
jgi:bifunctional DNase/RNase